MAAFLKYLYMGAALVGTALMGGYILPETTHIEHSMYINASPEAIFRQINNLHHGHGRQVIPRTANLTKLTYEGPSEGVGARISWEGGAMEVTRSVLNARVDVALDLGVNGQARACYILTPKDGGTHVIWFIDLEAGISPIKRYRAILLNERVTEGAELELAELKRVVEAGEMIAIASKP